MAFAPTRTLLRTLIVLLAVLSLSVVVAACGEDKETSGTQESADKKPVDAKTVEAAYLEGMYGHHESAIEMATIAQRRGQSGFVKNLSTKIISDQERELGQMKPIHKRLMGTALKPDMGAHEEMGLTAAEAGMDHDAETNKMLESANPFDRAFVDEMVPHHKGAVRMSQVVLKNTKDPALRNLAETIITAQDREVRAMNAFRTRKYGGPVPEKADEPKMEEGKKDSDAMESEGGGH